MQKVRFHISRRAGFSVVEVLLATAIFGFLVTALVGAIIFGRQSTALAGERARAVLLADEGTQAVRNIRDASFGNLTDGTYGLTQTSGTWTLSGSSDTAGIFTRQITIAASGTNRKTVTSLVSWSQNGSTSQVSVVTHLTNWMAALPKLWTNPSLAGSYDLSANTNSAIKVATQGNYAYVVLSGATQDFLIIDMSNPATPTLVKSLALTGTLTNVAVSGNYAYVTGNTDTTELMVINVTNPASAAQVAVYNAAGNADGLGIFISGNYAYLSRAANGGSDELVILNISSPAAPTRVYGFSQNIAMNEVYVSNNTIYVATNLGTAEVIKYTPIVFGMSYNTTNINLPGTTTAATTIMGNGSILYVGQGTTFHTIDGGTTNSVTGSVVLPSTINDISLNTTGNYAYAGTNFATAELQIVSTASNTSPSIVASRDIPGTSSQLGGVAYNASLDVVVGASASDTQEVVVFAPN